MSPARVMQRANARLRERFRNACTRMLLALQPRETGEHCPACGHAIVTDGDAPWCSAECGHEPEPQP